MIDVSGYMQFGPTSVDHYKDEYDNTDSVELVFATEDQARAALDYCANEGIWGWARVGNTVYLHDLSVANTATDPATSAADMAALAESKWYSRYGLGYTWAQFCADNRAAYVAALNEGDTATEKLIMDWAEDMDSLVPEYDLVGFLTAELEHVVYVEGSVVGRRYMTTESFDTDLPNWFERYPSDQFVRWLEVGVDWVWFTAYKRDRHGRPEFGGEHEVSVHLHKSMRDNHVTWAIQV